MHLNQDLTSRPIRVVMFGSGPRLEPGVKRFIVQLEEQLEISFLGAFCQSEGNNFQAVVSDLWRRRGWLAVPLTLAYLWEEISAFLFHPGHNMALYRAIQRLSDKIHFRPDIHHDEVLAEVRKLEPDLGLIYSSPILKPSLFEIPAWGTLGIHHGKVPQYRGKKTTFWALYNGEASAGVTIQRINAGLDTGEIVKAGEVQVGRRSSGEIWRELEDLGLELYLEAILDIKRGAAIFMPQRGDKGTLYRDPKISDLVRFHWRQIKRRLGQVPGRP